VIGRPAPAVAQKAATLLVLTRTPSPLAMSSGRNVRAQRYTPCQLLLNVRSHSCRESLTKLAPPKMPALLKTRST
jgi:hypothetical protein